MISLSLGLCIAISQTTLSPEYDRYQLMLHKSAVRRSCIKHLDKVVQLTTSSLVPLSMNSLKIHNGDKIDIMYTEGTEYDTDKL